jgi:serine protease Do
VKMLRSRKQHPLTRCCGRALALVAAACFFSAAVRGQSTGAEQNSDAVHQMSTSFQALAKRVSPAIVEIMVTGYGSPNDEDSTASSAVERERSQGSGVIVDPDGYIITNYHVVKGSERVRVVLTPAMKDESQPYALLKSRGRILPARVVGFSKEIDLAVLKVEARGLPTLPIGRYERLQKGQIVLAFGSPEGLENSVTFGLVSSVLRQPDPDDPMVYIQTDAAINPGNSGGPLLDVDGNMIGIDTFIYTKGGGNEGIGFAIPSGIARYAYEQIRQYGRVPRRTIGAGLQTLTMELAQALGMPDQTGVIVSDVYPDSSAEQAGLKNGDVITAADGIPVDNVAFLALSLYMRNVAGPAKLAIVRDGKTLDLNVPVYEPKYEPDRLSELADPTKDLIARLGIVGLTITPEAEQLANVRIPSGVIVTSIVNDRLAVDSGLQEGDVIHTMNRTQITSVDNLRAEFGKLKPGEPAAMQVERDGKLIYVTFEME